MFRCRRSLFFETCRLIDVCVLGEVAALVLELASLNWHNLLCGLLLGSLGGGLSGGRGLGGGLGGYDKANLISNGSRDS